MKTATFIRNIETNIGEKKLFRWDPPMEKYDGSEYEFIIVSAVNHSFALETFIFPANKDGEILSFGELDGSEGGIFDHNKVLQNAGYTVV